MKFKEMLKEMYDVLWDVKVNEEMKYSTYLKYSFKIFWISWCLFFIIAMFGNPYLVYAGLLIVVSGVNIGFADHYYQKDIRK